MKTLDVYDLTPNEIQAIDPASMRGLYSGLGAIIASEGYPQLLSYNNAAGTPWLSMRQSHEDRYLVLTALPAIPKLEPSAAIRPITNLAALHIPLPYTGKPEPAHILHIARAFGPVIGERGIKWIDPNPKQLSPDIAIRGLAWLFTSFVNTKGSVNEKGVPRMTTIKDLRSSTSVST